MRKKFSRILLGIYLITMCLPRAAFAWGVNPYEEVESHVFNWPLDPCPATNSPMYDRSNSVSISKGYHAGWDFAVDTGTPIYAIGAGVVYRVRTVGNDGGYGNCCYIEHTLAEDLVIDLGNGEVVNYGRKLYSQYCHMVSAPIVAVGDYVEGGQCVGYVGSTGKSTGPHLHMTIMSDQSSVEKKVSETDPFFQYDTKNGKPVYKLLASKGNHKKANFAPNMVCGVLKYVGLRDKDHLIDTTPEYGTGESFGTGSGGALGDVSSTERAYGNIGGVVVRGGKLVQELLDPGTGFADQEDIDDGYSYTGVMTDYGTIKTFNTLAAKMKDVIEKYSKIGAALILFLGTVSVGFGIILQNRNPEQRSFLITGLFAVGVGSLIVVLAVYIVNMVVKYM